MKIILSFCLLGLVCTSLFAQQGSIATGGEASGAGGTVSYTIGQTDYINANGIGGTVTQGLQQPYEIFVLTGTEEKNIDLNFSLYPNPTIDIAILSIGDTDIKNMSYALFDVQGKLIASGKLTSVKSTISMENLAMSTYFLKVIDNNKEVKTFKIIKTK